MSSKMLKERIKVRMLQNAAHLWGASDTDIEVNFDPLVAILLEACINEIEKINNEISNVQSRVLDQMVQMLTPDSITGHIPAHAIVHARSNESQCLVKPEMQFSLAKKLQNDAVPGMETNNEIFFSPAANFNLINGAVKYCVFHNRMYDVISPYNKNLIAEAEDDKQLEHGAVWLALELDSHDDELFDIPFFFDLKNNPSKNAFLHLLPYAKWSVNGTPLKIQPGLTDPGNSYEDELDQKFDPGKRFAAGILSFYDNQFVTVINFSKQTPDTSTGRLNYPEKFEQAFAKKDLQKIADKYTWISIEFPGQVTEQMLVDMVCSINCFPVLNKKLHEFTFRLAENLNIVPLHTTDYFFSVKELHSPDGRPYTSNSAGKTMLGEGGTYMVRQGGIERFDSRNATGMISHLLDLLRDESGAFTMLGNEFISSTLRELNQLIELLAQRTKSKGDVRASTCFLLVYPRKEGENLFVSFWSTNGEFANNIKAGSKLELYGSGDILGNSIMLMTTTKGGRGKLDERDRLAAFRSALISRGRIVTANDIRMFCLHELGKEIDDVKVSKGFMVSNSIKGGFVQTIDVKLQVAKNSQVSREEWRDVCEGLSRKLMDKSTGLTPIRVVVN
jgi:hypothetical protein